MQFLNRIWPHCAEARINTFTIYYTRSQEEKAAFLSIFSTFLKGSIKKVGISYTEPLKKLRKYLAQLCMAHGRKLKLARVLYKKSRRKSSCFVHSRFTGVSKQTSLYISVHCTTVQRSGAVDSAVASTQPQLDRDLELRISFGNCMGTSGTIICPSAKLNLVPT